MQSRNVQVPAVKLSKAKKTKQSQTKNWILAFLYSITLTEMISTCKMFFLILIALKGHLPLNVALLSFFLSLIFKCDLNVIWPKVTQFVCVNQT